MDMKKLAAALVLSFGMASLSACTAIRSRASSSNEIKTPYLIDAHSQITPDTTVRLILDSMRSNNVRYSLISTRLQSPKEAVSMAEIAPERIGALMRTKHKSYNANDLNWYKDRMDRITEEETFLGLAEAHLFHARKKGWHAGKRGWFIPGEKYVLPKDDRIKYLADLASRNKWPLVLHLELSMLREQKGEEAATEMLRLLVKFLNDYQDLPVGFTHFALMTPSEAEKLIVNHPSVFFLTSHGTHRGEVRYIDWTEIFDREGNSFLPEWERLFVMYPDSFVFAADMVWHSQWVDSSEKFYYDTYIRDFRSGLANLPADVAEKIAHGNTERLWGIK